MSSVRKLIINGISNALPRLSFQTLRPLFLTASSCEMPRPPVPPGGLHAPSWTLNPFPSSGTPLLPLGPHTLKGLLHTGAGPSPKLFLRVERGSLKPAGLVSRVLGAGEGGATCPPLPGHPSVAPQYTPQDRTQLPAQLPCSQLPSPEPGALPPSWPLRLFPPGTGAAATLRALGPLLAHWRSTHSSGVLAGVTGDGTS